MSEERNGALVRVESAVIEPTSFAELRALAKDASDSAFFGAASPQQAIMIMMAGRDLGLSYTQSLRAFHVIEGKCALSADGMVAVCLSHRDVCEYFRVIETSDTQATVETKRVGEENRRLTFTIAEAERAGLVKDKSGWKKWPSRMCLARAKSFLAREVYPDLLMGLYDPDEVRESSDWPPQRPRHVDVTTTTVKVGDVLDASATPPASTQKPDPDSITKGYVAAIASCSTLEELDELAKGIKTSGLPRELLLLLSTKSTARRKDIVAAAAQPEPTPQHDPVTGEVSA